MLNQVKTEREFVKNSQECKDFVVDEKILGGSSIGGSKVEGEKKKIKINMGGVMPMMAKKKEKVESEDWGKMMAGQQEEFPNYF